MDSDWLWETDLCNIKVVDMKKLLQRQRIKIDNHHQGSGKINYYEDPANDIHLHKTMYNGRKRNGCYEIRVPLNSERPVTVNREEGIGNVPKHLLKEVRGAFKNQKKRENFIKELSKVLKNYPIKNREKGKEIDRVFDAMRRIAQCFTIEWDDKQIKKYIRETKIDGLTYICLLKDNNVTYYISIKKGLIISKIGHKYVKEWCPLENEYVL